MTSKFNNIISNVNFKCECKKYHLLQNHLDKIGKKKGKPGSYGKVIQLWQNIAKYVKFCKIGKFY